MFQAGPVERDPEELHALIMSAGQDTRQARDIPGTARRRAGEIRRLAHLRCEAKVGAGGVAMGRSLRSVRLAHS